ncbi:hypothetical protein [Nocardia sp. NPDC057440]|uniref:hypothetical protein n=1 Tax=Nocardia sp. NPDC057440 TaxID=3346134 RepID=UPI00366CF5E6
MNRRRIRAARLSAGRVFVLGIAGYVTNPVPQSRVFVVAPGAPTPVGATNTVAFNVGNTLAPILGGMAISAGLGFTSVAWVGAALGTAALVGTLWAGHVSSTGPHAGAARRPAGQPELASADA